MSDLQPEVDLQNIFLSAEIFVSTAMQQSTCTVLVTPSLL